MQITQTNLDFATYFMMIAVLAAWVLGFKTITTKGKIGHFIEKFFEKKKKVKVYCNAEANMSYDNQIRELLDKARLFLDSNPPKDSYPEAIKIAQFHLNRMGIQSDFPIDNAYINRIILLDGNKYLFYKEVRVLPDKLVDPIIGCPTCMPSLHGLLVYSVISYYFNWNFNPFEWIFIAIPTSFVTEQLWKLRQILQKK